MSMSLPAVACLLKTFHRTVKKLWATITAAAILSLVVISVHSHDDASHFTSDDVDNDNLRQKLAEDLKLEKRYKLCFEANPDPNGATATTVEMPATGNNNKALPRASDAKLFCRFGDRFGHPLLLLNPIKEEILSADPLIVFFHDILLPSETRLFKDLAQPQLRSGRLEVDGHVARNFRRADEANLPTRNFPRLNRNLEAIVGLSPHEDSSDLYQVIHYGISGHYVPHVDMVFDATDTERDNYMATIMFYLNTVEGGGGALMFPKLRLLVQSEQGGAVIWYNFHRNETMDFRTLHAGCPVFSGTKWVVTKRFFTRGQWWHKPCLKNQMDNAFDINRGLGYDWRSKGISQDLSVISRKQKYILHSNVYAAPK